MITIEDISTAEMVCKQAHEGQTRRDGSPYWKHPFGVADMLDEYDYAGRFVALLHDVVEDIEWTMDDLKNYFKEDDCYPALLAVNLLTKKDGMNYDDYIGFIACNPIARRVKVADMIYNLTDDPTQKQKLKYRKALMRLV